MRVLVICGSRRGGFTSEMCVSFAEGAESSGADVDTIYPLEMSIGHCTGCGLCSEDGECTETDDMNTIYDMFGKADMVVLASPVRFSGPSSIIKTVIDRFQTCWYKEIPHPRYAAALMCGGSEEPRFRNLLSVFKSFAITAGMEWAGDLEIPHTDILEKGSVAGPCREFGEEIVLRLRDVCR